MDQSAADAYKAQRAFFKAAFGDNVGLICLAYLSNDTTRRMHERFYMYPNEAGLMIADIAEQSPNNDVYYCPQMLKSPKRNKDNIEKCPTAWADLDECTVDQLFVPPTVLVESSPGRYQALWVFDEPQVPAVAESISKKIAYAHAEAGCDKSGWDLSQLLRVPGTPNHKYASANGLPTVKLINFDQSRFYLTDFEGLPEVTLQAYELIPMPDDLPTVNGARLLDQYKSKVTPEVNDLFYRQPDGDWSRALFRLATLLFEAGANRNDVFLICEQAACNKFKRDGRSSQALWSDICRTESRYLDKQQPIVKKESLKGLLSDEERERVQNVRTFVEDYISWASDLGDAAVQYHQAGAFVILSALLAGRVFLPTSFGKIIPNLWFMILADTTLTRKSTAMDLAIDLLAEVDDSAIMATDGSIEGLMQGLSMRPGKPSIFLRDEFSGLLEMMTKKDYYAGMAEALTKLYDGKLQKRLLRKETIEVRDPCLITFAGGIRNRVQQLLSLDHISSGFVPRFVFITAVSDVDKVQPLGPPTDLDTSGREVLIDYLNEIREHYHQDQRVVLPGGAEWVQDRKFEVEMTDDAWERYRQFEHQMLAEGVKSDRSDLMTPVYSRLGISGLKAIILLAACRQKKDTVMIDVDDVLLGIRYVEGWRDYVLEVINGVGKSAVESDLERVFENIKRNPGITRSTLMRNYHLTAREADTLFTTLEQRGLVNPSRTGRGTAYFAVR